MNNQCDPVFQDQAVAEHLQHLASALFFLFFCLDALEHIIGHIYRMARISVHTVFSGLMLVKLNLYKWATCAPCPKPLII